MIAHSARSDAGSVVPPPWRYARRLGVIAHARARVLPMTKAWEKAHHSGVSQPPPKNEPLPAAPAVFDQLPRPDAGAPAAGAVAHAPDLHVAAAFGGDEIPRVRGVAFVGNFADVAGVRRLKRRLAQRAISFISGCRARPLPSRRIPESAAAGPGARRRHRGRPPIAA